MFVDGVLIGPTPQSLPRPAVGASTKIELRLKRHHRSALALTAKTAAQVTVELKPKRRKKRRADVVLVR